MKFDPRVMSEVLKDRSKSEHNMTFRHPWFNVAYNWLVAFLVVCLFVSFGIWGVDIHATNVAEALTATAMADYQAQIDAEAEAEAQRLAEIAASEESVMKREAEACAKMIFGIQRFIEKYNYTSKDLKTYVRCAIDRVENPSTLYPDTLEEVVAVDGNFLGYSDSNPVLNEYYKIAYEEIETWHHETTKPWSNSFVFAELDETGIWLKDDINADGYARRMRYQ